MESKYQKIEEQVEHLLEADEAFEADDNEDANAGLKEILKPSDFYFNIYEDFCLITPVYYWELYGCIDDVSIADIYERDYAYSRLQESTYEPNDGNFVALKTRLLAAGFIENKNI